jgi:hypothetical protein
MIIGPIRRRALAGLPNLLEDDREHNDSYPVAARQYARSLSGCVGDAVQ